MILILKCIKYNFIIYFFSFNLFLICIIYINLIQLKKKNEKLDIIFFWNLYNYFFLIFFSIEISRNLYFWTFFSRNLYFWFYFSGNLYF